MSAPDEILRLGASWYPEMWPEAEWPRDLARMREIGFNLTRVFEFAWHRLEPREGDYDFDWALKILDLCAEAGIGAMIGTPTAAPPAWLTAKYPDVLKTKADGKRATHGMRKHYSVHSARYRDLAAGIVTRMAEDFAGHPAVHSWQIDNEMGGGDFGDEAHRSFHRWLEQRYATIEALNAAWGLEFWSQAYSAFDQIPLPTASVGTVEVPERHHPSLIIASARWLNDAWSDFIGAQCAIIRAHCQLPISTNMTSGLAMNWFQHNRPLDRVGQSLYRDVEHYAWNVPIYDRMRAEKPAPFWLLETAPGWSAGGRIWNIHHDARGVRAATWLPTLLGGSMVLYWQWREHWAGQEMLHGTLVTATGQWRPNRDAIAAVAREWETHGDWLLANPPAPAGIGLVLSNEAAWAFSIDPIGEGFRYDAVWRDDFALPLARAHLWRDVIAEDADFSSYKVLVLPLMPMLGKETRQRLREWVEAGGRLILGPITGFRSGEFTAFTDQTFGGLEELIGGTSLLRFPVHWVEESVAIEFADGVSTHTRVWCESYEPTTGEALAHYRGGYGDGGAAIIRHQLGRGTVTTLGGLVDESTYLRLIREQTDAAGLTPLAEGSPHVVVIPRGPDALALVNLREDEQTIRLPHPGTDLLTGRHIPEEITLAPLEVIIVRRTTQT